jgi:hypothetical protein
MCPKLLHLTEKRNLNLNTDSSISKSFDLHVTTIMQTTSQPESQLNVNTVTDQLGKICLSNFLLLEKEDTAPEINFF